MGICMISISQQICGQLEMYDRVHQAYATHVHVREVAMQYLPLVVIDLIIRKYYNVEPWLPVSGFLDLIVNL